jgi:hypothetical protein
VSAGARLRAAGQRAAGALARAVPPRLLARVVPAGQRFDPSAPPPAVQLPDTAVRLLVAPVNSAGQGYAWARAAERLPGVGAQAMAVRGVRDFGFATDQLVPLGDYRWSRAWQRAQRQAVLADATHVLLESAKPLFGDAFGRGVRGEIEVLRAAGIRVALAWHGSDVRDPAAHRARERHSPYADGLWALTPALQVRADRARALIEAAGCPLFVSTPDLLLDVPEAVWLPVVVEPERWRTDAAPLAHGGRPIVAHAPSTAIVKGTDLIDGTLRALEAEGLIEYRRIEGISSAQMPAAYGAADIVLDQFRIGSYGVAACEAMAAGRIVVSHVAAAVRDRVQADTGLAVPIVQAEADELEAVLRGLLSDPSAALATAAAGPAFVAAVHDGALSARQLAPWLEEYR